MKAMIGVLCISDFQPLLLGFDSVDRFWKIKWKYGFYQFQNNLDVHFTLC